MLFRILKKDLKRRKGVNIILFLFITLATVFLASSLNNIMVVSSALEYYMDYAKVPDVNVVTRGEQDKERIDKWLKSEKELVKEYDYNTYITLPDKTVLMNDHIEGEVLDSKGQNMLLGMQDAGYNKVFDTDGNPFVLKEGQIAIAATTMGRNDLAVGDCITIKTGDLEKEFTIKYSMKDAAFGNEMTGLLRLFVSSEDFDYFSENSDYYGFYYIMSDDVAELTKAFNEQGFPTAMNLITKDVYKTAYSFDLIMAALLILIGICMILIALLVLRFTMVFTMEEDYQEIGIMKAVGFRGFFIKRIYLVKYLAIVSVGALLGLFISIPVSSVMIKAVSKNMIMEESSANIWSNVVSAFIVVILVLLFCYFCTRKLNKVSAVAAIRGGQDGERYTGRKGIQLYHRKKMPVFVFLGINDMVSHLKRYLVLIITFCISFILITIPLNTLNTMKSEEMASKFSIDPNSAVIVRKIENSDGNTFINSEELKRNMRLVEQKLKDKGYDAKLTGVPIHFFSYYEKGEGVKMNLLTVRLLGDNTQFATYTDGSAPELSNEVAFSEAIMKENKWKIGDMVAASINGSEKTFVITGTYSDYMQLGKSARLNPVIDLGEEPIFDSWCFMVDMETDKTQKELVKELSEVLPEYEWTTASDLVNQNVGGIRDSLNDMLFPMTAMLCAVIMLITLLMEKLFIVREKGEIAMMKSIGFKNSTIRYWQILRMVCVALVSMAAAVPMSLISNNFVLKPIFAIMGADVAIQVVPWQVYGVYPGILLVGIILATVVATRSVKKINIRELNNLE